jgi:DNA-binding NtrC family response regulator
MAKPRGRALVIDADPAVRRGLSRALLERDLEPLTAEDGAAGLSLLRAQPADVAIIDASAPGIEVATTIARDHPGVALLLLARPERVPDAVEAAWRIGAEVLPKPVDPPAMGALAAARAVERKRSEREAHELGARASQEAPAELAGASDGVRQARRLAGEAARTAAPLLVIGEQGTGRDALARFVHERSRRNGRAFLSLSCAQLADDPAGGRLFGDGAHGEGLVDLADRGTLFLDAVEALPRGAQDRLLALLSRGEARSGAVADVRIIGGTAIDLREHVRAGTFREELFYRLRALELRIPPLRDRLEDVPLLAYGFLRALREEVGRDVRRISPGALRVLMHQPWPGNTLELRSVLSHAVALARSDVLVASDLPLSPNVPKDAPDGLFDDELAELPYVEARRRALDAFEQRYTRIVVEAEQGNLSSAARRAGMDRSNFKRLLRRAKDASR